MYEANSGRRRWESGETAGTKEKVAPKWLGISWPSKGTSEMDMIRKQYEKKKHPARTQGSDRDLSGKEEILFTPMTKTDEGTPGSQ